jgi:hypothetical protein
MRKILTEDAWREERSRLAARFIGKLGKEAHLVWRNYLKAEICGVELYQNGFQPRYRWYRLGYRSWALVRLPRYVTL